jgi:hypothetical protein
VPRPVHIFGQDEIITDEITDTGPLGGDAPTEGVRVDPDTLLPLFP